MLRMKFGCMKVKKWSLMSDKRVPEEKLSFLEFVRIWSIAELLLGVERVTLWLVTKNPEARAVSTKLVEYALVSSRFMLESRNR